VVSESSTRENYARLSELSDRENLKFAQKLMLGNVASIHLEIFNACLLLGFCMIGTVDDYARCES
jgi:hypothetical protein